MLHAAPRVFSVPAHFSASPAEPHDEFRSLYDETHIVIDLTGIDTIDPALFTQLAQLRRHRHSQGLLRGRLVVDSRNVRNALSAVGFERLWPIFSTLEEAIASFGGPPIYA